MSLNSRIGFKILRKLRTNLKIVLSTLIVISQASCTNAFKGFATKTDDESLNGEAIIAINKGDYAAAIEYCADMSSAHLSTSKGANTCASAYAGRCGFTMFDMTTNFNDYFNPAPTNGFLEWMLTSVTGSTAQRVSDCDTAIQLLHNYAPAADRSANENGFLILLSIYTMSVALDLNADSTPDDGAVDGGFDACAVSAANAQVVGLAYWELFASLTKLQNNAIYSSMFTTVDAFDTALSGNGQGHDLTASTTPTALSAAHLKGARSILKEGSVFGVNACGGGAGPDTCFCP